MALGRGQRPVLPSMSPGACQSCAAVARARLRGGKMIGAAAGASRVGLGAAIFTFGL